MAGSGIVNPELLLSVASATGTIHEYRDNPSEVRSKLLKQHFDDALPKLKQSLQSTYCCLLTMFFFRGK
jgi:hypothetical protein